MPTKELSKSDILKTPFASYHFFRLDVLEMFGITNLTHLPYSIRVLLESLLRQRQAKNCTDDDVFHLASWQPQAERVNFPFYPARIIMQDFTGVPALVDLAAMRSALSRMGKNAQKINPSLPLDLVIDHSLQVDHYACADAELFNTQLEFKRNQERYQFLRWGQKAFSNFRIVPPATGIIHQVNIEYLAQVVTTKQINGKTFAFPDSLVGTDSHTTMVNALGVLGWGVGGIEAEAVMLGQPLDMLIPDVIGFCLNGSVQPDVSATDIVLTITSILRKKGIVGKFVEFFGEGVHSLSLADRATISNMAPEYGATIGFFPVDDETLRYLKTSGRSEEQIALVERYCKEQLLFYQAQSSEPTYSDKLSLDLASVEACIAGPKRPQDLIPLKESKAAFISSLKAPIKERGFELEEQETNKNIFIKIKEKEASLTHGSVIIAAITSCTNTSNPSSMIAAGLLAKNALDKGLTTQPYVKTSLAPGSRVVSEYLIKTGLLEPLNALGFNVIGYGCATCIGNSGPLLDEVVKAIKENNLVVAAVLSGNRNFEGRIHPFVRANYLASPALVVAYALVGRMDIDLTTEPLGLGKDGKSVFLHDILPSHEEVTQIISKHVTPALFRERYQNVFEGSETWNKLQSASSDIYSWDTTSTYIQEPPFFQDFSLSIPSINDIKGARILASFGDSITTDHISPAGSIAIDSPAGKYLQSLAVQPIDFNSYGARRGNDQVMLRGTFANIRLKNRLTPGKEGGITKFYPHGDIIPIYEAAMQYQKQGVPLIILAGKEYGSGSSRDWAAKGTMLLGVKAVIAQSYERIHRSNLVGMGVLPLQFLEGESAESLGLSGEEVFAIPLIEKQLCPNIKLMVEAVKADNSKITFTVITRLDTPKEIEYYRNGGILAYVLRELTQQ